jgi:hypothetical protein
MKLYISVIVVFCWLSCGNLAKDKKREVEKLTTDSIPKKEVDSIKKGDTISLIAVGDIMFGTTFPNKNKMPPNDGNDLLQHFTSQLKDADITFGNAEGVFLDSGGTPKGIGGNVFCFRQPKRYANFFTNNGFDLISIANNHIADFGNEGIKSTVATLQNLPIDFAGTIDHPTTIIKVRNCTIGMAAFAPHKGCVSMNDLANAAIIVKNLKTKCDVVFVSYHAGAEGSKATHVPKRIEIFFGQNRGDVYKFSHTMIDAGADIVIGHGPHVARGMELYKNKFIAYSLGNFCTYGMFNLDGVSGIAPLLKINVNENGDFINGTLTSIKQIGEGGPLVDSSFAAFNLIKKLSETDFPGSTLKFKENRFLEK